jgi:hypothetical protein
MKDTPNDVERHAHFRDTADSGVRAEALKREIGQLLADMRQDLFETFALSPIDDTDGHQLCRMYVEVLKDLEGRLVSRIERGKAAHVELSKVDLSKLN